jgi:hypothetical protein
VLGQKRLSVIWLDQEHGVIDASPAGLMVQALHRVADFFVGAHVGEDARAAGAHADDCNGERRSEMHERIVAVAEPSRQQAGEKRCSTRHTLTPHEAGLH